MTKKVKAQKNPKTYVTVVLDKSGSMESTKTQTVQGYNEQVEQMQINAKEGQEILCSLVTFNGNVYEHLWNVPVEKMQKASAKDYVPSGGTAMRDGVGYAIQKLLDTTDHENEDNAYLVVVISDGGENSSNQFTASALREMIQSCESTKRWTFTYMGCDKQTLKQVAQETGIGVENMAMWDNSNSRGTRRALHANAVRTNDYFRARSKGETQVKNFYSDKLGCSADYTSEEEVSQPMDLGQIAGQTPLDLTYRPQDVQNINIQKEESSVDKFRSLKDIYSSLPKYQTNSVLTAMGEGHGVFGTAQEINWGSGAVHKNSLSNARSFQSVSNKSAPSNVWSNGKQVS